MFRKILPKLLLLFSLITLLLNYSITPNEVRAQGACDLCGYCAGGTEPSDYQACRTCMYDGNIAKDGVSWTVLGCVKTDPGNFTQQMLQLTTAVIGGAMFLVFLYGGFKLLTSAGDPQQLATGKRLVTSSIIALLLIIFSLVILRFVGVEVLKLPGFE